MFLFNALSKSKSILKLSQVYKQQFQRISFKLNNVDVGVGRFAASLDGRMLTSSTDQPSTESTMSVSYRLATLDDYEDVMAIGRDLFDGLDYLPYTYHKLTNDPTWMGMCALIDGKVIGFNGAHVVDGGDSVVFRATRFLPEYHRKSGMKNVVVGHIQHLLSRCPNVSSFSSTVKSDSPLRSSKFWKEQYAPVLSRSCVAYKFPSPDSTSLDSLKRSPTEVCDVDKAMIAAIFDDKQTSSTMFTDGFISARYVFMKPIVDNIDFLFRIADHRLASYDSNSGNCTVLTLANHFPCTAGYAYHLECYGSSSEHKIEPHIYKHVKVALESAATANVSQRNGDLYVFVYGRKDDYDFSWLGNTMRTLGAVPYELTYDCYIGLRNYRDQNAWQGN